VPFWFYANTEKFGIRQSQYRYFGIAKIAGIPEYQQHRAFTAVLKFVFKGKYHCKIAGDFNCGGINWHALIATVDGIQDKLLNS